MDNQEVVETLKAANSYLNRLKLLDNELENAVKQITTTFQETDENIRKTFADLKTNLINVLEEREKYLLDQANKTKSQGLFPLEECRQLISNRIQSTNKLINIGSCVKNGTSDDLVRFTKNASLLGSLPEVPELKEVPYISFCYEPSAEGEIKDILAHLGLVCKIAPIQIMELVEKPGAILVEWQVIDSDERLTDIQEFKLQRAFGDVIKDKHLIVNFKDCYRGLDTQFLVKDLQAFQPYSFRVCCKFEGTSEWSPWSLPQVFRTSLKPFCWRSNDDYVLSIENKIVTPSKNNASVLYSDGAQFLVGHSVEFTFLEVDASSEGTIGLVVEYSPKSLAELKCTGEISFLLNQLGRIFIDGCEKLTVLPAFAKGLKVCFTCDLVNEQKVRVNIDSDDKRVTYDWPISPSTKMYFVSQFASSKWKLLVE